MFSFWEIFPATTKKTDTTAQLYCTLSTYVTPKTISRQNQKTNTMPQLCCTLIRKYVKPKPISRQNQKMTQQHNWVTTNWLSVFPAHAQRVYSSFRQSFCPSVRAKRGIWSKRVFMRTNGNFSFSVRWRNTTIIH